MGEKDIILINYHLATSLAFHKETRKQVQRSLFRRMTTTTTTMTWPPAPCYFAQFLFSYIEVDIESLSLSPLPHFIRVLSASFFITMASSNKQHRRRHKLETTYPFYRGKYARDLYARIPFSVRVSSSFVLLENYPFSLLPLRENIKLEDGPREHHHDVLYLYWNSLLLHLI